MRPGFALAPDDVGAGIRSRFSFVPEPVPVPALPSALIALAGRRGGESGTGTGTGSGTKETESRGPAGCTATSRTARDRHTDKKRSGRATWRAR